MSATPASIKLTASIDCPSLVPEAQALTEIAGNIMKGLRRTVQELRLNEIDDIGLLTSLEGLIAITIAAVVGRPNSYLRRTAT